MARVRCAVAFALLALALLPAQAQAQFQVGLQDAGLEARGTGAQIRAANAALYPTDSAVVRIAAYWATIAPGGTSAPAGFRSSDPSDPRYRWSALDSAIRSAAQNHQRVMLEILDAPAWAEGPGPVRPYVTPGSWNPNPTKVAAFVHALALRYSGNYADPLSPGATLPRVNYWEPWNEPNIPGYFSAPNPVSAYRTLLNRAYAVLKAVHRDNVVVLGGLAPVSTVPGSTPPLDFGAQLLCLRRVGAGFRAARSCPQRADFDVFAVHPYSLGATPTKPAYKRGDVLVGDMSTVGALVQAADRLHTASPRIRHQLWVTEFAWLTKPPNSQLGDSEPTAARYVAYSMYEMWKSGVSLVIWQTILDEANNDFVGGGLYRHSGQPKLTLQAFAFPVVAGVSRGHGFAWGRVPVSRPVRVVVQRLAGRLWHTVATLNTGPDGVFYAHFGARGNGTFRAQVIGGPTSLSYDSRPIPRARTHSGRAADAALSSRP